MSDLEATPGQTIGPFYGFSLPYAGGPELVPAHHRGAIRLHGNVYDGDGAPVPDAMIEIWQPDDQGNTVQAPGSLLRDGHTFTGWGRCDTDRVGHYDFTTLTPGDDAFIAVVVFARGLLNRLFTRVYLPTDQLGDDLAGDAFLAGVPADRRATLVATPDGEQTFRFDIHLQGDDETVFLTFPGHAGADG